jgi:redox-sensitive bicupin YhaK (pirin superfamily)
MIHHADMAGGSFPISPSQIMVMNAGNSFWHEEQTKLVAPAFRTPGAQNSQAWSPNRMYSAVTAPL